MTQLFPQKLFIGCVSVLLIATLFVASPSANHSWNGYHWARTANPFTVKLGDNLSSGWTAYLLTASK